MFEIKDAVLIQYVLATQLFSFGCLC